MVGFLLYHFQNRAYQLSYSGLTKEDVREIRSAVNGLRWESITVCIRKPALEPLRRFSRELITGPSSIRADENGMRASVYYKDVGGGMDADYEVQRETNGWKVVGVRWRFSPGGR
jgi:hypothetical protein